MQTLGKMSGGIALAILAIALPACQDAPEVVGSVDPVDRPPEAAVADPPAGTPATGSPADRPPEAAVADPPAGAPAAAVPTLPPPSALTGRTFTASVDVRRIFSPKVFTIQDQLFYGGRELLVVRNDTAPPLKPGQNIEITGTFGELVVANLEREYDYDLAPEVEVEFRDRPYVLGKAVEAVD